MREEAGDLSLRRALSCLRYDWIYDFLFSEQSDMLRRALVDSAHFGGTYLVQTDGGETPLPPQANVNERGSMLFVCAAMHGPRSVGFEVVHKQHTLSDLRSENVYLSRIVRDDETGVLLSISQMDDLDLIEVSYCTIITPGCKEHAFLLFRKQEFLNMTEGSQHRFDERAARKAIAYRLFSTEWRQCPKCGSQSPSVCGCRMNLVPKESMFDNVREAENFLAHTGSHAGVAEVSVFDKDSGDPIFSEMVKSRSEINVLSNLDEKKRLATWAMNHAINQKPLRLLHIVPETVIRESYSQPSQDVLFSKANISLDLGDALGVFEDVLSSPRVIKDGTINLSSMWDDVVDIHEYGLHGGKRYRPSICAMEISNTEKDESGSNTTLAVEEDNGCESISALLERAIGDGGVGQTASSNDNVKPLLDEPTSNWDESKRDSNQTPVVSQHSQQPLPQLQQQQQQQQTQQLTQLNNKRSDSISLTLTNTTTQATKTISKSSAWRQAVRIAPAPYSVRTEHIDANQRKLELRKARNRASAQRSNLKKKLALQKLKDDLKSMSKREGELRGRERVLREENLKLRAAVCR